MFGNAFSMAGTKGAQASIECVNVVPGHMESGEQYMRFIHETYIKVVDLFVGSLCPFVASRVTGHVCPDTL